MNKRLYFKRVIEKNLGESEDGWFFKNNFKLNLLTFKVCHHFETKI